MGDKKDVTDNKAIAAVGYIGILFLIPLLKKDSPYAQFHAKQGLVLFILEMVLWVVAMVPVLGWIVSFVGGIIAFILFIIGLLNALNGKTEPLPIIGKFAGQFKI
jgi:uncharacterized membrane protein